uniref:anhydro-N-acetylmuramic acid kinase n=1 Tax=Orrella sp. TaxID=1921583 RepID=UPI0040485D70
MLNTSSRSAYIGLMSGTSLDGVDGVLVNIAADGSPSLLARSSRNMPLELKRELLALNTPADNELHRAHMASMALVDLYAQTVAALLRNVSLDASEIVAIGAHGQTVRHRPDHGYTVQLNAPALLAEKTGIDVIADFRSRDMACGGQGAPLVPALHHAVFASDQTRVILNLGGIANVTLLEPGWPVSGFDTGPANLLMDGWCQRHTGQPYDSEGCWGDSGEAHQALLDWILRSEAWFDAPPPKSTGRDQFNLNWLDTRLAQFAQRQSQHGLTDAISAVDVQATLQMLTACTVTRAVAQHGVAQGTIYVCGGGAKNVALLKRLQSQWAGDVQTTDALGVPAQDVEAMAFAWLAWAHQTKKTGNLPEVTGAAGGRLLGARWPA